MSALEEAKKSQNPDFQSEGELAHDSVFEEFRRDRESIAALAVTAQELKALSNVSLLGTLKSKADLLFILSQIREAAKPDLLEPSLPDAQAMTERMRRAAMAKLIELDAAEAEKRNRSMWNRIKTVLSRRNNSAPAYRVS